MALFISPVTRAADANNNPLSGAKWWFYESGGLVPVPVYTTSARTVAHANPVVADAGGLFAPIYLDPTITYRAVLKNAAGATIQDIDPYNGETSDPVTFSLDDYLTAGDDDDLAATNNLGAARLTADVQAAGRVKITARPATYVLGGLDNQPFTEDEQEAIYNWLPAVDPVTGNSRKYLLDFDGMDTVIFEGSGATFKNASGGKFGTFDPVTGEPRSPATMPYAGASATGAATPFFAMIRVQNCTGLVEIRNLTLDGNRAGTEIGSGYGDTGIQLEFTGLNIKENTATVLVENVDSINFGLDGCHINEGFTTTLTDPRQRVRVIGCATNNNGRNGISLVGGRGILFEGGESNGNGAYSNPKSGIDIESEGGKKGRDIVIRGYDFIDNANHGFVADSGDSADALFENCRFANFTGAGSAYVIWGNKPGITFKNCKAFGTLVSLYTGSTEGYPVDAVYFEDCEVSNDPVHSPTGTIVTNGVNGQVLDSGSAFVEFRRCKLVHNHAGSASNANVDSILYSDCTFIAKAGGVQYFGRFRGRTAFVNEGAGVVAVTPGAQVSGTTNAGHALDSWTHRVAAGTTTTYPPTINQATGTVILSGSKTHNFGSIANGAQETTTVTVTGAALGDYIPFVSLSIDHGGLDLSAYVSAVDTATVVAANNSGGAIDLASATLSVRGFKKP